MNQYTGKTLLLTALVTPASMTSLSIREWEILIGAARQTRLLAHLNCLVRQQKITEQLPASVLRQMNSAAVIVSYHQRRARWELNRIKRVLDRNKIEIVLLKGSAYLLMDLRLACGREMRDVDLLIREADLNRAEQTLASNGWVGVKLDDYDQQYYRKWMHELPPMRHSHRVTEVDLHHSLLPRTSRLQPNPEKMFSNLHRLESGYAVLAPQDMVLHSAAHLFYDGALDRELRDLIDLAELFAYFGTTKGFWDGLIGRAEELDMGRPIFYALHFSQRILNTPIPPRVLEQAQRCAPTAVVIRCMNHLVERALLPSDPHRTPALTALSRWLLYMRSHWLRMPPLMLARHLFHKGVISNIHNRRRLFE